jgi:hypothetical protein
MSAERTSIYFGKPFKLGLQAGSDPQVELCYAGHLGWPKQVTL